MQTPQHPDAASGRALVQLARHRGLDVEGMASAGNLALARGLGADPVHDYRLRPLSSVVVRGSPA